MRKSILFQWICSSSTLKGRSSITLWDTNKRTWRCIKPALWPTLTLAHAQFFTSLTQIARPQPPSTRSIMRRREMIRSIKFTGTRRQYHSFYNYEGSVELNHQGIPLRPHYTYSAIPNHTHPAHTLLNRQPSPPTLNRNNPDETETEMGKRIRASAVGGARDDGNEEAAPVGCYLPRGANPSSCDETERRQP